MQRYRIDVLGDLGAVDAKIASNRKSAGRTLNAKSAQIADATLPALERKRAALLAELETAPERPPVTYAGRSFKFEERRDFPSAAELDALAMPAFLKRRRA